MEDVTNEQKENLDDAAAQFRARQRQRLQVPDQLIDRVNPNTPTENTNNPNQ
jgi:hypothetical protein